MIFFRLSDKRQGQSEYYTGDKKALYLGDIKQLNIIVGANNTRKSRFIRQMIAKELKVLIESEIDINLHLQETDSLFSGTEDLANGSYFIDFVFDTPSNPNKTYQVIKSFFDKQPGQGNQLNLTDVKAMVEDILSEISSTALAEGAIKFKELIEKNQAVLRLASQVYRKFSKSLSGYSYDTLNPTQEEGIRFKFPNIQYLEGYDDYEERLAFLDKVLIWMAKLDDIKIVPYHETNIVYIPVLRSSRSLEGANKDTFTKTIKTQYKLEDNNKLSIETGLDLYDKIEAARNGHRIDRENFSEFETFLSEVFFQSRLIDIIAVKGTGSDKHVKISIQGDNDDIPIHDLGDGIQAIIILLLPIFTARKGSWIFIDEPENNLHPGYQNVLMKAISENKAIKEKDLRFFINTHSNHILSEALLSSTETEILVFSRRDKDSSNINTFDGNEQSTMEMLGVLNTSVLISNCSIWVEGVTDRLYLRAFLKAYCDSKECKGTPPIEGFQYSFVEYAGNNLVHYCFDHELSSEIDKLDQQMNAFFINSNVFLLADSDFSQDDKHAFYDKISEKRPNFHYYKTEVPEIENLLPDSILKFWLIDDIGADKVEVEKIFLTKNENLKLGAFLSEKLSKGKGKRKFMKKSEGGTLRSDYKSRLADYVHKGISSGEIKWEQLKESKVLDSLIINLHKFIAEKNQGAYKK